MGKIIMLKNVYFAHDLIHPASTEYYSFDFQSSYWWSYIFMPFSDPETPPQTSRHPAI